MAVVAPLAFGLLSLLEHLQASRPVALGVMTVLVAVGVVTAFYVEDRHGKMLG